MDGQVDGWEGIWTGGQVEDGSVDIGVDEKIN